MSHSRIKPETLRSTWRVTLLGYVLPSFSAPWYVAGWYDHPKARHVWSGHHFMVRCDPDQDLGLFPPKKHQPLC